VALQRGAAQVQLQILDACLQQRLALRAQRAAFRVVRIRDHALAEAHL
jgi:hypothetical protein